MLIMRMMDAVEFKIWWMFNSLETISPASDSSFQCVSLQVLALLFVGLFCNW